MWTDGSFYNNESAIGVYFARKHELNISRKLEPPHSCALAEITAAIEGLKALINWPNYKYNFFVII